MTDQHMVGHHRLYRARKTLAGGLAWFAATLLVIMTLLVLYQVFTRYGLNQPAAFTEELVRYALIWTSFTCATYAFVERRHMALVLLRDKLPPRLRRILGIGIEVLVLLFAAVVLVVGGVMLAWSARHDYSALLQIPRGFVYAIVPIAGMGIVCAQVLSLWEETTSETASGPTSETTSPEQDGVA